MYSTVSYRLCEICSGRACTNILTPVFRRRGAHKAKKVIEKWIDKEPGTMKYILKMDIRHFFDTVPHSILKAKLARKIHDEQMLDLLFKIIEVTDVGLPLESYTSQWLSNWYLQEMDITSRSTFMRRSICGTWTI